MKNISHRRYTYEPDVWVSLWFKLTVILLDDHLSAKMMSTHLDGLYPEWDEFYLLVCDICGIIIRPQALDKHLATKHGVNLPITNHIHDTNHNSHLTLPNNRNTSNNIADTDCNSNSNNHIESPIQPQPQPQAQPQQGTPQPQPHEQPQEQQQQQNNQHHQLQLQVHQRPCQARRWQVRKWRNTFHVLRDAFF